MSTKKAPTTETYPVTLDRTVPLADQIKAGNYAFVSEYFTPENFTLTLTGKREVTLYDPKGFVSSETMIARMKADGCVPATLDDCLAFGALYPDRQKKNRIVFLGTIFRDPGGNERVPVLNRWFGWRGLVLYWFDRDLHSGVRFAAVREL